MRFLYGFFLRFLHGFFLKFFFGFLNRFHLENKTIVLYLSGSLLRLFLGLFVDHLRIFRRKIKIKVYVGGLFGGLSRFRIGDTLIGRLYGGFFDWGLNRFLGWSLFRFLRKLFFVFVFLLFVATHAEERIQRLGVDIHFFVIAWRIADVDGAEPIVDGMGAVHQDVQVKETERFLIADQVIHLLM